MLGGSCVQGFGPRLVEAWHFLYTSFGRCTFFDMFFLGMDQTLHPQFEIRIPFFEALVSKGWEGPQGMN